MCNSKVSTYLASLVFACYVLSPSVNMSALPEMHFAKRKRCTTEGEFGILMKCISRVHSKLPASHFVQCLYVFFIIQFPNRPLNH